MKKKRKTRIKKEDDKTVEFVKQTVRKVAKADCNIVENSPENFPLLKENRSNDEKFSRVCKFTINHYYTNESGECIKEHLFYPSEFGILEIDIMQQSEQGHHYTNRLRILREKGIGRFDYSNDELVKKPKRIKLQVKPQRVRLKCKS